MAAMQTPSSREEASKRDRTRERFFRGEVFLGRNSASLAATRVENAALSRCASCDKVSIWANGEIAYPPTKLGDEPNPDLPDDIVSDYEEARRIVAQSPRGAAALLRLSIQKLCKHLGEPGKNINTDISSLVAKGLDRRVQRALDVVRVVGNESVHPGQIDLRDDNRTAIQLFKLVNLIAEKMISEPKHVDELYESLPSDKLAAIEQRDGSKI